MYIILHVIPSIIILHSNVRTSSTSSSCVHVVLVRSTINLVGGVINGSRTLTLAFTKVK